MHYQIIINTVILNFVGIYLNFSYFLNIRNSFVWKREKHVKEDIQIKVKLQQVHLKILCNDK